MKCPYCIKVCKHCKERIGEARLLVAYGGNFVKGKGKYGFNCWCKECMKVYKQSDKGKESDAKAYAKFRQNNPEYMKQYYKDNPDVFFNNNNKRRSREENQGGGITKEQWVDMMNFFEWRCAYSGETLSKQTRSIDHIIPLAKGGLNEPWNCVPMTKSYNSSKQTSNIDEWYITQDFYSEERLNKIYEWQEYAYNKYYEEQ